MSNVFVTVLISTPTSLAGPASYTLSVIGYSYFAPAAVTHSGVPFQAPCWQAQLLMPTVTAPPERPVPAGNSTRPPNCEVCVASKASDTTLPGFVEGRLL